MFARRPRLTAASLSLVLAVACIPRRSTAEERFAYTPVEAEAARLFYQDGIPIAVVAGTPEQIAKQHAALLATPAKYLLTFPKRLAKEFGAETYWPLMVGAANLLMRNAPERYHQELTALAAAGKLDAGQLAVGNTLLELRRMGCSALLVEKEHSATGAPLFGRNFDFITLGELDQYSLLMVVRPEGRHAFATITFPGAVGVFSAMNDSGLAVATLDVYDSADGSPMFNAAGIPLTLAFRRIVEECTTVAEAEALLRSIRPTTWMNLAVCDRDGAAVFEITPKTIGRREPESGVLACTNHFRTAGLTVEEECWRYPRLMEATKQEPLTVEAVRERLHAANQGKFTLQTMVFEPQELAVHLAFGKPPTSDDKLTRIDLAPLFEANQSQSSIPLPLAAPQ
jgi:isopenicillin-N N-acyltransferase-like protein